MMEILFEHLEVGLSLVTLPLGIILTCTGLSIKPSKVSRWFVILGAICFITAAISIGIISKTEYL